MGRGAFDPLTRKCSPSTQYYRVYQRKYLWDASQYKCYGIVREERERLVGAKFKIQPVKETLSEQASVRWSTKFNLLNKL